jgi:C4-dicarboxylate-specific signal transduction histidine kinase
MRILLADDDHISLRLLENLLKKTNHELLLANDGDEAWRLLQQTPRPDIALLDWMMPGLDGLEIIRKLRQGMEASFVYIILVTSNNMPEDITAGLDAGANDYITKPFNKEELKSRIDVGCRVVEYEMSLKTKNEELFRFSSEMEHLAQSRAQQLVQADRMITLGTMAAGIAHEINNPLTVIQGNLGLIKGFWKANGETAYRQFLTSITTDASAFYHQPEEVLEMIMTAATSVKRIRNIIDGMRSFSHGQGGSIEEYAPAQCIEDAIQICMPKVKHLGGVKTDLADAPFPSKGNPVQITQALVNLIANAADALSGQKSPEIAVALSARNHHLEITVQDNGPGISPEHLEDLWSPFFTTKPVGKGTGLGLAITKKIITEHGGNIAVTSSPETGTCFKIILPNPENYDLYQENRKNQQKMDAPSFTFD